ncbi:glycoside hydrolase superfamily [Podospora appendiculata]|uniref:Glycoside hydrolase superfamily n=1 Tax=Podospora appendiculata TaxID=314037 RepID=A0AAE0XLS9_9PEZI|nr:glycoside hydrolase superfamily [Podospora appendiculata]
MFVSWYLVLLSAILGKLCHGIKPTHPLFYGRKPCTLTDTPANPGMRGYNGIYWGWNPDIQNGAMISAINSAAGKNASTIGLFSQINSPDGYDGHQLLSHLDAVKSSKATLIASIMPNGLSFDEVTPAIATDVANVIKKFTDEGIEVWLRFAHEMNWYVRAGTYRGNSTQFIQAWRNIHAAVKDIEGCLLFWCPNNAKTVDLYAQWWPGADYVDIVGMDQYVSSSSSTFKTAYGDFYDAYAKKHNKHMAIPETATKPADVDVKEAWVYALSNKNVSGYPCFKSVTWFELDKSYDFRVVMGQSEGVRDWTMSNFW